MTTLTMRAFVGEADLAPLAEFINRCEALDQLEEGSSVDELRREFQEPGFDPQRDMQLWEDASGQVVGFGQLWIRSDEQVTDGGLWLRVEPGLRNQGLEQQIIEWAEQRLRDVAEPLGTQLRLRSGTRDTDQARLDLLAALGFAPIRYFFRMQRPLDLPIPEPQIPSGFTLRHVAGIHEAEQWVEMFNQSFIDHWNFHPLSADEVIHDINSDPNYHPEQDLIVVAADGTFAAFCDCRIHHEENARSGRNEGWIRVLGTRRGYRRLGLGRAMLLAGLHQLRRDGAETALLGVDAENPSGALGLYESVGFSRRFTYVSMSRIVH